MKHAVLIALALTIAPLLVKTQFRIDIQLREPPPAEFYIWSQDPTIAMVTVTSLDADYPEGIYIGVDVRHATNPNLYGRSRIDNRMRRIMGVRRNQPITLSGPQIINTPNIEFGSAVDASFQQAGVLPEGQYLFCIRLYDNNLREITGAGTNNCRPFTIRIPEQIMLIRPLADARLRHDVPNVFSWTGLSNVYVGVRYRLVVAPVFENQVPLTVIQSAFNRTGERLIDVTVPAPTTDHTMIPNLPELLVLLQRTAPRLTGFVWQVQALDDRNRPIRMRNSADGKSDWRMFTFETTGLSQSVCTGPLNAVPYWPADRDTIPWIAPHLIVQWGPYCDNMEGFRYRLMVNRAGTSLANFERTLNWSSGVLTSQGLTATTRQATERARLIVTNWRDNTGAVPPMNAMLRRGETIEWRTDATILRSNVRTTQNVSMPARTVSFGLRQPQEPSPRHDGRVLAENVRELSFVIPAPAQPQFEPADLHTARGSDTRMEFGMARERVRVRLSRLPDLSSPIVERTYWAGRESGFVTGEDISSMFGTQRVPIAERLTAGRYYWRVEYLDWQNGDRVYRSGPTWDFLVESNAVDATTECIRIHAVAPENRGLTPRGTGIQFSVSTNPVINISAIRGGRMRVWRMTSAGEAPSSVRTRPPVADRTFSGNDASSIVRAPGIPTTGPRTYLNLPFMNGALNTVEDGASYLWDFELEYDGSRIRDDGTRCELRQSTSLGNIFTVRDTAGCNDPCELPMTVAFDRTPSSRIYAPGDEIIIGHFRARLTQVSPASNGTLRGEAEIPVPLLQGRLAVVFDGIRVNQAGIVYDGEMRAKVRADSPLDSSISNRLQGPLGLNRQQMDQLWGVMNDVANHVSVIAGIRPMTMPLGFDRTIEGQRIVIGIIGVVFQPRVARMNVGINIPVPWHGPDERLGFGVRNLCFSPQGFGQDIDLALLEDLGHTASDTTWSLHIMGPRDANSTTGAPADDGTYVRFDCYGFKELRIKMRARFPRTWMIPVNADGVDQPGLAEATLSAKVRNPSDIIAEATMTPFRPTDVPDFVMFPDTISFDFSTKENPRSMVYPTGYRGDMSNTWKGFYINKVSMRLPEAIRTFDSTRPVQVHIRSLLIDRSGFSMTAVAENIIQHPRGNFGDWGASLDTFRIAFASSSFVSGALVGRFKIPISDSSVDYSAVLNIAREGTRRDVGFDFRIKPRGEINAPIWIMNLRLDPVSQIRVAREGGRWLAEALLHGHLSFNDRAPRVGEGSQAIQGLDIRMVRFDSLRFRTHTRPYISFSNIALASPQHRTSGFDVTFTGWSIQQGQRTVDGQSLPAMGLQLGARFHLQSGNNGVGGDTRMTFWGGLRTGSGGPPSVVFAGVSLDEIGINADLKAVRIAGRLRFYDADPVFGNGFRGSISATFIKIAQVDGTVQFGAIPGESGYTYWYVDAKAALAAGIPIVPGLGLYGFGGGAWYNMTRTTPGGSRGSTTLTDRDRAMLSGQSTPTTNMTPGQAPSGSEYRPSQPAGGGIFGFYALATLGTHPKAEAFNADVRILVEFGTGENAGLREISLEGEGYMMASISSRANAPIEMGARMRMDFVNTIFTGNFSIRANMPKQAPVLMGTGMLDILVSPTNFYFKFGQPPFAERLSLSLVEPISRNPLVTLRSYLMFGTNLDVPVLRPDEFPRPMWDSLYSSIPRPQADFSRGDGFALGSTLVINPPDLEFLFFYAQFRLVMGFDIALLNVGRQSCASIPTIGANGFYAKGSMYAFISGAVGLQADLGFWKGRLEVLSASLGAMLEGGTPNPTWLAGAVRGSYNVLGGLIRGNLDFRFSVGERCVPARNIPLPVNLLTSITPQDEATNVYPTVQPVATSNFEFGVPFDLIEMYEGQRYVHTYRIMAEGMTIVPADRPTELVFGSITVPTDRKTRMIFAPSRPLAWGTGYVATARAKAEQAVRSWFIGATTWWADARNPTTGEVVREQLSSFFTTMPPPDSVIPEQVWNTYPRNRQRFFLQNECREGFVLVNGDYSHLFRTSDPKFRYEYFARFVGMQGAPTVEVPATYRLTTGASMRGAPPQPVGSGTIIEFRVPTLQNASLYALQIVRRRVTTQSAMTKRSALESLINGFRQAGGVSDAFIRELQASFTRSLDQARESEQAERSMQETAGGQAISVRRDRMPSALDQAREVPFTDRLLFLYFFRTSMHNSLQQKVAALRQTSVNMNNPWGNIVKLEAGLGGSELFDAHDVTYVSVPIPTGPATEVGTAPSFNIQLTPLIDIGSHFDASVWAQRFVRPDVYGAIQAMQGMWSPRWTPTLRVDQVRTDWARDGHTFRFINTTASFGVLTDAEIAAANNPLFRQVTKGGLFASVASSVRTTAAMTSTATEWRFDWDYPLWVCFDWGTMRERAAFLRTAGCFEILGNQTCAQLIRWQSLPFEIPGRGVYDFWMSYRSPCAVNPDFASQVPQHPFRITW
jgi:hypothetical protein